MMNWRPRPLALFLPIAFLFLPQPEGVWARGRGHGHAGSARSGGSGILGHGSLIRGRRVTVGVFWVGEVLLRGTRFCKPCRHLEDLTQKGVLAGLIHRGGLRARILTEGRSAWAMSSAPDGLNRGGQSPGDRG